MGFKIGHVSIFYWEKPKGHFFKVIGFVKNDQDTKNDSTKSQLFD